MSSRTTVTLDDDVLERVKAESRARGISFKQAVNDLLRRGLISPPPSRREPFRVKPRDMGEPRPGVNFDCIGELLEYLEGPMHR